MKLNNDKIIDVFINISYLLWGGLFMIGTSIILLFAGLLNAEMIVLTIGIFVFCISDVVSAACATTKNRFSNKNIKINIIATSIRIALFVPLIIIGITKNTLSSAFGLFVIPIIDVIYLILIIKIKKMTLSKYEIAMYQKIYSRDRSRYSLVKKESNSFFSWTNYFNENAIFM